MNFSHQPGFELSACDLACDDAERPVWIRIAFDLSVFSLPQVSYASSNSWSTPPLSRKRGPASIVDLYSSNPDCTYEYAGSGPDSKDFVRFSRRSRHGNAIGGLELEGVMPETLVARPRFAPTVAVFLTGALVLEYRFVVAQDKGTVAARLRSSCLESWWDSDLDNMMCSFRS